MHRFLRWPTLLILLPFSASGEVALTCYPTGDIRLGEGCTTKIEAADPWPCATLPKSALVVQNIAHYLAPSAKLSFFGHTSDISVGLVNSSFDLTDGELTFPYQTRAYLFPRSSCPISLVVNRIVFASEVEMHGAAIWVNGQPTSVTAQDDCREREINLEKSPWTPKQMHTKTHLDVGSGPPAHGSTIVHFVRDDPVHGTDVTTVTYLGDKLAGLSLTQCETGWGEAN